MELFRALGALAEPPGPETARLTTLLGIGDAPTAAEYTNLFVLNLYPYASVYLGPEGMLGGEGRDRIAGFWRALGLVPPAEPDHLALMLAQYAGLAELAAAESDSVRRTAFARARSAYLYEHLLSWLPPYLDKLAQVAPPTYAAWGRMLEAALLDEARHCGEGGRGKGEASMRDALRPVSSVDRDDWRQVPLALRAAGRPALGTDAGIDDVLKILFAPASSGIILVQSDLARAARSLGLGLRIGERRFVLRALLSQAPEAVVEWIRTEASAWAERHAERRANHGPVAVIAAAWERQARATMQLAEALKDALHRDAIERDAEATVT
jgi:TorA maturation chaperone TorD